MKKLALFLLLLLPACGPAQPISPEISYKIVQLVQNNDTLTLSLSLQRDDLGLKHPDTYISQTEAPLPVQTTKLIAYTETAAGTTFSCDIENIPNTCTIDYSSDPYILHAFFADGSDAKTELYIPSISQKLGTVEITSPNEESEDNSILEFTEINADYYTVLLQSCYSDDNCLSHEYKIENKNGISEIQPGDLAYFVELKKFGPSFRLNFEFEPELYPHVKYTVTAHKEELDFQNTKFLKQSSATYEIYK